jgi:hypothetical protein
MTPRTCRCRMHREQTRDDWAAELSKALVSVRAGVLVRWIGVPHVPNCNAYGLLPGLAVAERLWLAGAQVCRCMIASARRMASALPSMCALRSRRARAGVSAPASSMSSV